MLGRTDVLLRPAKQSFVERRFQAGAGERDGNAGAWERGAEETKKSPGTSSGPLGPDECPRHDGLTQLSASWSGPRRPDDAVAAGWPGLEAFAESACQAGSLRCAADPAF